jgi:4-hydroxybenzoate polyprenyltransferase
MRGHCLAWWQLLRVGNLPTALSNVLVGFLLVQSKWLPFDLTCLGPLLGLALASALFYESGMVLNDLFDVDQDSRERPERPIPSGRITRRQAAWVGGLLLAGGLAAASGVGAAHASARPMIVATLLGVSIVAYDFLLKQTWLAPLAMGCCRMLNVLLGASLNQMELRQPPPQLSLGGIELPLAGYTREVWLVALAVGLYTAGLTWFARTEAKTSRRRDLAAGGMVIMAAMLLLATLPTIREIHLALAAWVTLWVVLVALAAILVVRVVAAASPSYVQFGVKLFILGFILLDAAVCLGVAGPQTAIVVLSLLVPTLLASRLAPMT